jgi:hypothetical protein
MSLTPYLDDLWNQIQLHPDFIAGAIFTKEDVIETLYLLEDRLEEFESLPEQEREEIITNAPDHIYDEAAQAIEFHIFGHSYTWRDGIDDTLLSRAELGLPDITQEEST